jgi:uncharacterized protein (DUF305 family)
MNSATSRIVVAGLLAALPALLLPTPSSGALPPARASLAPADTGSPGYTDADVRFMQHMMGHHAQALVMTSLVPDRTRREAIRTIARRIAVSQHDEIAMMRRWLERRRQTVPEVVTDFRRRPADTMGAMGAMGGHDTTGHDAGEHAALMPGMLTADQLAQLERASGAEFDRLFLQFMIRHHEGALAMVSALFASQGAGQEPELFRFASDVDADQRAEIRRMHALLDAPPSTPRHP